MTNRRGKLFILGLVVALALGLVACGGQAPAANTQGQPAAGGQSGSGAAPAATKTIVVGTEPAYPPFESVDEKTKEIVGFDVDLMNAVAKAANLKAEFKGEAWDGLIPSLQSKQIDAIISAMTITSERAQTVTFSDPYFTAGQIAVVKKDSPINGVEGLQGKKVGVQANTTGQFAVEDLNKKWQGEKKQPAQIVTFKTTPDAFNALLTGSVDAVVADNGVVMDFVKQNAQAGVRLAGDNFTVEYYGIAMRKEDTSLHTAINKALAQVKASGEYQKIYDKWFGK